MAPVGLPHVHAHLWIAIIGLRLYFIFGRRGAKNPWEPGRSPEGETALDSVYIGDFVK